MKNLTVLAFLFTIGLLFTGCGAEENSTAIESSGTIEAVKVTVSAKTSGEIKVINFNEGDEVKQGDTILVLDPINYGFQVQQALANNELAKAQLDMLRNGARREDIAIATENRKQAETRYNQIKTDFDRMKTLKESGSISGKQFDDAEAALRIAETQLHSAKESVDKVSNFARPEEIRQATARVDQTNAALSISQKQLNDCFVLAPSSGIILNRFMERGETAAPLSNLFSMADMRTMEIVIYIPLNKLGQVKVGNKADITIDAMPERKFTGTVSYISSQAEFTPKTIQTKDERTKMVYAVKIRIPNEELILKDGMPADATIHLQ